MYPRHNRVRVLGICLLGFFLLAPWSRAQAEPVQLEYKGIMLNAELALSEGKSLADPLVLLLHGAGAHHGMETISGISRGLVENGIGVLAVTLSLGVSDRKGMMKCEAEQRHRHTDALAEVDAWLKYLRSKGAKKLILMGHSWGGNQIARYASRPDPGDFSAVVLLAPMTWSKDRAEAQFAERFKRPLADALQAAKRVAPGDVMEDIPFLSCPSARATAASFLSYYAADPKFDTPVLLPKIRKPVLLIAGSKDQVVADLAGRIEKLNSPGLAKRVVDDADHFFLDFFADDVAEAVTEFIGGLE